MRCHSGQLKHPRRLDQRPLSWRSPSSAPLALRARFAAEGVLCRGFFMVSCIVPSSPRRVSQETVQRTTGWTANCLRQVRASLVTAKRPASWRAPRACAREAKCACFQALCAHRAACPFRGSSAPWRVMWRARLLSGFQRTPEISMHHKGRHAIASGQGEAPSRLLPIPSVAPSTKQQPNIRGIHHPTTVRIRGAIE